MKINMVQKKNIRKSNLEQNDDEYMKTDFLFVGELSLCIRYILI